MTQIPGLKNLENSCSLHYVQDVERTSIMHISRKILRFTLTHYRPAMPFGNRKKYFRALFSSVLSQCKKYHPSGNLKFNYLGIFQSLKLHILM